MDNQSIENIQGSVIRLVSHAGARLMEYFTSGDFPSHSKGGVDFATQADDEIDQFLRESLAKQFPSSQFLTEETAPKDFSSFQDKENLWVIDPIDGTLNFSRGSEHFAISVALVDKAKVKLAVVFLPAENKLYTTTTDDSEALCNKTPMHVSKTSSLETAVIACDWPWSMNERKKVHKMLGNILTNVRGIKSMGSAAADLSALAEGKIDGYFITGIKPWDMAAATLFIEKAGGKITKLDGSAWNIFDPEVLASNGVLHEELVHLLSK